MATTKVRDYSKLAADIIKEVGGKDNISNVARCATRLRLVLKETPKGAKETIGAMPGVITVVENGGQFQIVIGTHVGDVYDVVANLLNLSDEGDTEGSKGTVLNRIIATMSAVFAPFIYVLAAAGILQGCLILITLAWPEFANTGTYEMLSFLSWTPFTYLPVFIAITAARHFKTNIYIAVVCCCALVNPSWGDMAARIADGETIRFLGMKLAETTYTSSVLPPLFLVWILSYVEKFVKKHLPDVVKSLFTPLICMVVMVPLTILLIGPLSTLFANGVADGYNFLAETLPVLAGIIVGGFWQVFVIFGVHWGITPVVLSNFDRFGQDSFQAFQTVAVIAQVGAAIGVMIKTKSKELKNVSLSAGITGIFGITEPTLYGVTLRLKKPFICACISGAIGAVVVSLFHSYYYVYAGLPGFLTLVNAIDPSGANSMSLIGEIAGVLVGFVGAIILVQIIGFDDPVDTVKTDDKISVDKNTGDMIAKGVTIKAPIAGKVVPLSKVPDEVFSQGVLGEGCAIEPSDNKVYAPFNGTIVSIFDTHHAFGLESEEGVEVLIHVGLDTVNLEGKYFTPHKQVGDTVAAGDLLLEFDADKIKEAGYQLVTPVIITNDAKVESMETEIEVKSGDTLIAAAM